MATLNGNTQTAIDIHCHNVFPEFVEFLESKGMSMEETYPLPQWDIDSHLIFERRRHSDFRSLNAGTAAVLWRYSGM